MTDRALTPDGKAAPWFGALMFELAEASGQKVSAQRVLLYARSLTDWPAEAVTAAARRAMVEGKGFIPSIGEIRAHLTASTDDRAVLAWSSFIDAAARVGGYQALEVEDPAAAAALIRVFGSWSAFCAEEDGPGLMVKRHAFLAAYRDAARVGAPVGAVRLSGMLSGSGRQSAWCARLTAGGEIVQERERADLPAPAERRQLTTGTGAPTYGE